MKLKKIRNMAFALLFVGISLMFLNILTIKSTVFLKVLLLILSVVFLIFSTIIYTFSGVLSLQAPVITCPNCNNKTKILGKSDRCSFCKVTLSFENEK